MNFYRVKIKAINVLEKVNLKSKKDDLLKILDNKDELDFLKDFDKPRYYGLFMDEKPPSQYYWDDETIEIFSIEAESKEKVNEHLKENYPNLFSEKIYSRSTKSDKQFFYARIDELSKYDLERFNSGVWCCDTCGKEYLNKYDSNCIEYENKHFCNYDCRSEYINKNIDEIDNEYYDNGIAYIYKITQKSTNKCYIGKTVNFPFFRWWNHYKHSTSPFGLELSNSDITDWTYEIIDTISSKDSEEVLRLETHYIKLFESNLDEKGFNKTIFTK